MVRGLYTAATGMTVQRNRMDVLTNNIVNAETPGYKSDSLLTSTFDEVMLQRINDPNISIVGAPTVGGYDFGTHIDELYTNFGGGTLEQTDKYTDLALMGDGFFTVETAAGVRYTRSGNFTVDTQGYLVTQDGNYVLGQNGRIYVGSDKFTVSDSGAITGATAAPDTLNIVTFADQGVLRKEGNNLYTIYGGAAPVAATGTTVRQGTLEGSNVDMSNEMVDMISVYRKYEASQKIVNMTDKTLELTVNLGRIGG
ncbi:flagellar basal-body rod protein FlgG [Sporobacter termitidis DSM 10068]|uniref:Flagellar basal-body rod protein FlgG n=1 Tax=Sporobacter termitidis DSM 10068 TaxID=1123282 RepID=A0A1M5W726_9FIRM|nr:flagellar basal-body rod protein FlgF [Sporobacter termitidis]SHH83287.1 flagellar basal-body rod protein FlgG [Sporobacter termitidis DSM 10068]